MTLTIRSPKGQILGFRGQPKRKTTAFARISEDCYRKLSGVKDEHYGMDVREGYALLRKMKKGLNPHVAYFCADEIASLRGKLKEKEGGDLIRKVVYDGMVYQRNLEGPGSGDFYSDQMRVFLESQGNDFAESWVLSEAHKLLTEGFKLVHTLEGALDFGLQIGCFLNQKHRTLRELSNEFFEKGQFSRAQGVDKLIESYRNPGFIKDKLVDLKEKILFTEKSQRLRPGDRERIRQQLPNELVRCAEKIYDCVIGGKGNE